MKPHGWWVFPFMIASVAMWVGIFYVLVAQ